MQIPLSLALLGFFLILPACSSSSPPRKVVVPRVSQSAPPVTKKVTPQTIKQEFNTYVIRPCVQIAYDESRAFLSNKLSFEEFYEASKKAYEQTAQDAIPHLLNKPKPARMKDYKKALAVICK